MSNYDVIIVGAGASGLFAGIFAKQNGAKNVLIIEKNKKPGEKLSITGGGRCNITNAEFNTKKFLQNYADAKKYLYSPFSQFSNKDTFDFFEKNGLPIVVEARKRAFPKTQSAKDVRNLLVKLCKINNIEIKTNTRVFEFIKSNEKNLLRGVKTSAGNFFADVFILSTGGMSAPYTGSTGDGFVMMKKLGHTIHNPTPDLVPLKTDAKWMHKLSGTSLSFATIRFKQNGKTFLKKTGKILFTHFGISGPLVINSSSKVLQHLKKAPVYAQIDMFPDTEFNLLEKKILSIINKNPNKQLRNAFSDLLPSTIVQTVLYLTNQSLPNKHTRDMTKEERKKFTHTIKELGFSITGGLGFDKAIIADGGVDLNEIDTKQMRSKLYDNLFITGDMLHIRRPSGGFSLQLCWTTGAVAGKHAGKNFRFKK